MDSLDASWVETVATQCQLCVSNYIDKDMILLENLKFYVRNRRTVNQNWKGIIFGKKY